MAEKQDDTANARTHADVTQRAAAGGRGSPRRGRVNQPEVVESAAEGVAIPNALGQDTQQRRQPGLLDRTAVAEIDGFEAAVPSEDAEVGANGLALPAAGEVGGGNIAKLLDAPPTLDTLAQPYVREQAAMASNVGKQIAGLTGRPVTEWGVYGPGDTVRGHMLLLDLNTGQKVRAMDGHRINQGELYMNLRNVPESLAAGDTIDRVLGA
jgi:hypothetical protein